MLPISLERERVCNEPKGFYFVLQSRVQQPNTHIINWNSLSVKVLGKKWRGGALKATSHQYFPSFLIKYAMRGTWTVYHIATA